MDDSCDEDSLRVWTHARAEGTILAKVAVDESDLTSILVQIGNQLTPGADGLFGTRRARMVVMPNPLPKLALLDPFEEAQPVEQDAELRDRHDLQGIRTTHVR